MKKTYTGEHDTIYLTTTEESTALSEQKRQQRNKDRSGNPKHIIAITISYESDKPLAIVTENPYISI